MRLPILRAVFLLGFVTRAAFALTTDNITQQLDASPGGKLIVDVDFGTVEVTAGADNRIDVQAERKIDCDNEAREKEYVDAAPITITKEGNTVIVRARNKSGRRNWEGFHHVNMDGHYNVKVPKSFDAELRTGGGAIIASNLIGTVQANTNGGKLIFKQLRGALNAKTSGGSVEVKGCEGPLNVATSGGGIDAAGGSGKIDARTSGGSIAVQDFSGDTNIATSGGTLRLVNINGNISGRTSGGSVRAMLAAPVPGDVTLDTSSGSIELAVPANAAFNIDARASVGTVVTDLPFVGERRKKDSLHGSINGGGKSIQLRSGAGSIRIHAGGRENPDTESIEELHPNVVSTAADMGRRS